MFVSELLLQNQNWSNTNFINCAFKELSYIKELFKKGCRAAFYPAASISDYEKFVPPLLEND
jgi:hypothetical protein